MSSEAEINFDYPSISKVVETKLNWFICDMISYEIELSSIERIVKCVSFMYSLRSKIISQILLLAKSKCEERMQYGESNQIGGGAAISEASEKRKHQN
jgi:hypothetical protein